MISQSSLDQAVNGRTGGAPSSKTEGTLVRRQVTLVGVTPLLMNRISEETLQNLHAGVKRAKNAARPTPREDCEARVHMHEGRVALPVQNLLACLIAAGQHVRLDGKRQISTADKTILPAFLSLEDAFLPVIDPQTRKEAVWEVDMRAGKNPNDGNLVCICRPRFDRWSITTTAQIDLAQIGENAIRELFDIAARRIGLGDFRPHRKGIMGQFRVDQWKIIKESKAVD